MSTLQYYNNIAQKDFTPLKPTPKAPIQHLHMRPPTLPHTPHDPLIPLVPQLLRLILQLLHPSIGFQGLPLAISDLLFHLFSLAVVS